VDNLAAFACELANHRAGQQLEARDIQLALGELLGRQPRTARILLLVPTCSTELRHPSEIPPLLNREKLGHAAGRSGRQPGRSEGHQQNAHDRGAQGTARGCSQEQGPQRAPLAAPISLASSGPRGWPRLVLRREPSRCAPVAPFLGLSTPWRGALVWGPCDLPVYHLLSLNGYQDLACILGTCFCPLQRLSQAGPQWGPGRERCSVLSRELRTAREGGRGAGGGARARAAHTTRRSPREFRKSYGCSLPHRIIFKSPLPRMVVARRQISRPRPESPRLVFLDVWLIDRGARVCALDES
jgi:hypothetical protein